MIWLYYLGLIIFYIALVEYVEHKKKPPQQIDTALLIRAMTKKDR